MFKDIDLILKFYCYTSYVLYMKYLDLNIE